MARQLRRRRADGGRCAGLAGRENVRHVHESGQYLAGFVARFVDRAHARELEDAPRVDDRDPVVARVCEQRLALQHHGHLGHQRWRERTQSRHEQVVGRGDSLMVVLAGLAAAETVEGESAPVAEPENLLLACGCSSEAAQGVHGTLKRRARAGQRREHDTRRRAAAQ